MIIKIEYFDSPMIWNSVPNAVRVALLFQLVLGGKQGDLHDLFSPMAVDINPDDAPGIRMILVTDALTLSS
jgi:hypothetical protein